MKYTKPPLTLEQQADLLLARGMAGDRATMIDRLSVVNYYRLSGYWHPFRMAGDETFKPNTTFEKVWQRYAFDRQLRLLVIDAIERIEVAVRAQLAYELAHRTGDPFAYATDPAVLPALSSPYRPAKPLARPLARPLGCLSLHSAREHGDSQGLAGLSDLDFGDAVVPR